MSFKFLAILFLIMGALHIIFNEPIARFNKRWYEVMPFGGFYGSWTVGNFRFASVFSGLFMIVYGIFILFQ